MHSKDLEELLREGARELGKNLSEEETLKFFLYMEELKNWNKKVNLTAITKDEEIIAKHFLDSLLPIKIFPFSSQSVIDVGTGAGFPGIPLKIIFPEIRLTLIDSVKKKTDFLSRVQGALNLDNTEIILGRAEEAAKNKRELFDVAISRAVAPLNILAEYCLPFVKIGGKFIALKEEKAEDEIEKSKSAFKILGGETNPLIKIKLPGTDIVRSIIIVNKIRKTPEKYPRRPGIPKKKPL